MTILYMTSLIMFIILAGSLPVGLVIQHKEILVRAVELPPQYKQPSVLQRSIQNCRWAEQIKEHLASHGTIMELSGGSPRQA